VGQTIAVLGVLAAVLGAAFRWDLPSRPAPPPPPPPATVLPAVRVKPRVTNKIKVKVPKVPVDQDNSNSSYAALGIRAAGPAGGGPSWTARAAWRIKSMNLSVTSSLKQLARKSILGRVT